MNNPNGVKRHRPTQKKIELRVYFLPDRFPGPLRRPLEAAGGPDALIAFDKAEVYVSPGGDAHTGWRLSLTICPRGEGHFMGIDLSIPEARKLRDMLDYEITWQENLAERRRPAPKRIIKAAAKSTAAKPIKARSARPKQAKSNSRERR
jgi:hypothetical protein